MTPELQLGGSLPGPGAGTRSLVYRQWPAPNRMAFFETGIYMDIPQIQWLIMVNTS